PSQGYAAVGARRTAVRPRRSTSPRQSVLGGVWCARGRLGLAPGNADALLLLRRINGVGAGSDILGQSLLHQSGPPARRGRASGAWVVAIGGGSIGQLQSGRSPPCWDVAAALEMGGAALVTVAVGVRILITTRMYLLNCKQSGR